MLSLQYSPQATPKMYRGGKMTGKAFVEESRRLSHREEGLFFQGAHRDGSPYAEQLASVQESQRNLYAAYKIGRES